ncbi:MAG: porphobilinogen synthase [Chlamydiota bacterium]
MIETETLPSSLLQRPRRNRKSAAIRSLVQETQLTPRDLVAPFFLIEGREKRQSISALPGIDRLSIDLILKEAEGLHAAGVPAIALFPVIDPSFKDPIGSYALNPEGVVPQAVQYLKEKIPSLCVITDIALDPFTSHGHDGILGDCDEVLNDETVEVLAQMAILHAQAGADIVAPSDMMDGRIQAIRRALDAHGHQNTSILSYAAKYASSLYAPFRHALGSGLKSGDKKGYQMNPANVREALREASLDEMEGADMLMVKPALYYLDVISKIKENTHLPVCAYHVSGEYAMVMAAHERGMLNAPQVFLEALLSIKRAGADFIFTYAASQIIPLIS